MKTEDDRQRALKELCHIAAQEAVRLGRKSKWFPGKKEIVEAVKRHPGARRIFNSLFWGKPGLTHFEPLWDAVYAQLELTERNHADTLRQKAATLAAALELERVEVAPAVERLASHAARLFVELVGDDDSVAVSCGTTLEHMATEVARLKSDYRHLTVYSGVVICSDSAKGTLPSTVANLFTHLGDVETLSFHFPLGVGALVAVPGQHPRHSLSGHLHDCVFQLAHAADFVFLGIGVLAGDDDRRGAFTTHVRDVRALRAMRELEVAGEVFHWPYDRQGRFLYDHLGLPVAAPGTAEAWHGLEPGLKSFFERTYTMRWSALLRETRVERAPTRPRQRRTTTVAVAGGVAKHEAIWIALSKLPRPAIDILVTDPDTLDYLVDKLDGVPRSE